MGNKTLNMKARIIILSILLISGNIYGQNYESLLENYGWCCEQAAGLGMVYREYYLSGETSIIDGMAGKEYLIQEDTVTRKVWYHNDGELELLYDFSLVINDTFNVTLHDTVVGSYSVSSIDTITTLLGDRKRWILYLRDSLSVGDGVLDRNLIWIEGIGSTYGPLYPKTIPLGNVVFDTETCLEAVYDHDRVQVFQGYCNMIGGYWPDECKFITSGISNTDSKSILAHFNAAGDLEITSVNRIDRVVIYDINGKQIYNCLNTSGDDHMIIPNHLSIGVYFCDFYFETNERSSIKILKNY